MKPDVLKQRLEVESVSETKNGGLKLSFSNSKMTFALSEEEAKTWRNLLMNEHGVVVHFFVSLELTKKLTKV